MENEHWPRYPIITSVLTSTAACIVFATQPRQVKTWQMSDVRDELKAVNARESTALADAFLSADFINRQHKFLASKGKVKLARVFWWLGATRPLWSLLMK